MNSWAFDGVWEVRDKNFVLIFISFDFLSFESICCAGGHFDPPSLSRFNFKVMRGRSHCMLSVTQGYLFGW